MFAEPPEPPTAVFVSDVSSRSVVVSWYPSYDTGNSPVLDYVLQYRDRLAPVTTASRNVSVGGSVSSATLSGLQPDTEYQVQVFSSNSVGLGAGSRMVMVRTREEAPSGPPTSVRVEAVSSTEIRVTWQVCINLSLVDIILNFDTVNC